MPAAYPDTKSADIAQVAARRAEAAARLATQMADEVSTTATREIAAYVRQCAMRAVADRQTANTGHSALAPIAAQQAANNAEAALAATEALSRTITAYHAALRRAVPAA